MSGKVRTGSSTLLYFTGVIMGCSVEKDRSETCELLLDTDMHLFIERGIRGGISMVSKRYAKANNPYVKEHAASKPNAYIQYLDANE